MKLEIGNFQIYWLVKYFSHSIPAYKNQQNTVACFFKNVIIGQEDSCYHVDLVARASGKKRERMKVRKKGRKKEKERKKKRKKGKEAGLEGGREGKRDEKG